MNVGILTIQPLIFLRCQTIFYPGESVCLAVLGISDENVFQSEGTHAD